MVRIFLAPSDSVPCPTCWEEENCDHNVLYFNGFTLADVSALALTKWTICLYFIYITLRHWLQGCICSLERPGLEREREGDDFKT